MMSKTARAIIGVLSFCFVAACSQTGIRRATLTPEANLPRPERILVYDFAVSQQEVKEYQGIMRQQPSVKDSAQRERELARQVVEVMVIELADGLRDMGFVVQSEQSCFVAKIVVAKRTSVGRFRAPLTRRLD